jgi:hypothetical protein
MVAEQSQSSMMTDQSATEGAFLLSLESELKQDPVSIRQAVLVQALFARRVCLTDSQLIDSPALEAFVLDNQGSLNDELDRLPESHPPMLGTFSRAGADILGALDVMLTPNVRTGLPTYFSRLEPEQNTALRTHLENVTTQDERRRTYFNFTGHPTERYLQGLAPILDATP